MARVLTGKANDSSGSVCFLAYVPLGARDGPCKEAPSDNPVGQSDRSGHRCEDFSAHVSSSHSSDASTHLRPAQPVLAVVSPLKDKLARSDNGRGGLRQGVWEILQTTGLHESRMMSLLKQVLQYWWGFYEYRPHA